MANASRSACLSGLPQEIINEIVRRLYASVREKHDQSSLATLLLVNQAFLRAAGPILYRRPILDSSNIRRFVACVSGRRSADTRELIQGSFLQDVTPPLDKSSSTSDNDYSGTRCYSRLSKDCAATLKAIKAPRWGFDVTTIRSIGLCAELRELDLAHMADQIELSTILATISKLKKLERIKLHERSRYTTGALAVVWPPNLKSIAFAGGINDSLLGFAMQEPIRHVTFNMTTEVSQLALLFFLECYGCRLEMFETRQPLRLANNGLDRTLKLCPNLVFLQVAWNHCSSAFFDAIPVSNALKVIEFVVCPWPLVQDALSMRHISRAIRAGLLPHLKEVKWLTRPAGSQFWNADARIGDWESAEGVELSNLLEQTQRQTDVD